MTVQESLQVYNNIVTYTIMCSVHYHCGVSYVVSVSLLVESTIEYILPSASTEGACDGSFFPGMVYILV